jgi:hypothetical protein
MDHPNGVGIQPVQLPIARWRIDYLERGLAERAAVKQHEVTISRNQGVFCHDFRLFGHIVDIL